MPEASLYTRILVPLDGSTYSERALPMALALARQAAAEVELVHVHDQPVAPGLGSTYDTRLDADVREMRRAELEAVAERLREETDVPLRATVLEGPVAPTLAAYAANHLPALIVMTTHGRGGLSRLWLGSVADALVRRSEVPVLLIRGEDALSGDATPPVFRHVLIPLDGSPRAESVIEHAVRLGIPGATRYTLLTVVAPTLIAAHSYPGVSIPLDSGELERRQQEAQTYLDRVADELRQAVESPAVEVTTRVAVHLQVAPAVLEAAASERADLIALTTHDRGAVSRLALGSVADKLVRGAESPVLVIRRIETDHRD